VISWHAILSTHSARSMRLRDYVLLRDFVLLKNYVPFSSTPVSVRQKDYAVTSRDCIVLRAGEAFR